MSSEAVWYLLIGFLFAAMFSAINGYVARRRAGQFEPHMEPVTVSLVGALIIIGWPFIILLSLFVVLSRAGEYLAERKQS